MAEYASKGVAGAGLGLGIAGTALALLGNGGLNLGGLFGCGSQLSAVLAENAALKAENYSDKVAKEVYIQNQSELKSFAEPTAKRLNDTDIYLANMEARVKGIESTLAAITKTVVPISAICPTPQVASTSTTPTA